MIQCLETYMHPHLGGEVSEEVAAEALKALGHAIDGILLSVGFNQVKKALHGVVRWYLEAGAHLPPIGAHRAGGGRLLAI